MYSFYFHFDVADHVFTLYHFPVAVHVEIEYNWLFGYCICKIFIMSNNKNIWESEKKITTRAIDEV